MNLQLTDDGTGVMLQYIFSEASTYIEYSRARFNLIDVLSQVGSLYNPFYLAGYFFTMTFSYNLMMSSIIRKLYAFNARFASEVKDRTKKRKRKEQVVQEQKEDSGDDEEGDLHQQFREIKKMYKQEHERQKTAAIKIKESMN